MAKSSLIIITTSSNLREKLKADLGEEFNLTMLESGSEALKAIQKRPPDAIVMDHSLEDFLTHHFIDKVRNNAMTRNMPFILVSRESSHAFVEQAVRSGVSHYVGVPYERAVFVDKVKTALNPTGTPAKDSYFSWPASIPTHVLAYGRISYISKTGIHIETHLKLQPGDQLEIQSPLCEGVGEQTIKIQVTEVTTDVFYNYPFAVDAAWADPEIQTKIGSWVGAHRSLNSPKKSKVLFVCSDLALENKIVESLDKNQYSPRFEFSLAEAVLSLPFMKPVCLIMDAKCWKDSVGAIQQKFLKTFANPWMIFGADESMKLPDGVAPLQIPPTVGAIVGAVRTMHPPQPPDPDRIYFSKMIEDSRVKIHLNGKVQVLGEMGVELALEKDLNAPCNLQLDLKTFTDQNFRNPFIRVWPPTQKLSVKDGDNGQFKVSMQSHFLGINDSQSQAVRQWLRDEEMKERKKAIADIAPKPKPV